MDRFVSAFWDRAVRSTSSGSASNSSRANRFVPRRTALVPVLLLVGVSGGTGGRLADEALALGDTPPTVTIVAPSGGEQYVGGSRQDIEYTVFDPDLQPLTVTIDHSTNDGVSWQQILSTTNANGSFSVGWDVPNATYANGRVRVTANDGATAPASAVSSAFSVTSSETGSNTLTIGTNSGAVGSAAALSVSLANEDVVRSLEMDVVFDPEILSLTGVSRLGRAVAFSDSSAVVADGTVRIFLQPSGLQTIAAGSGSILSLSFQLEAAGSSDVSTAAFMLSGLAGNALEATSVPGRMNVTGGSGDPPVITLVSPQGGETFVGGSVATIQYVASGGEEPLSVAIEYSGNDGASYSESGGSKQRGCLPLAGAERADRRRKDPGDGIRWGELCHGRVGKFHDHRSDESERARGRICRRRRRNQRLLAADSGERGRREGAPVRPRLRTRRNGLRFRYSVGTRRQHGAHHANSRSRKSARSDAIRGREHARCGRRRGRDDPVQSPGKQRGSNRSSSRQRFSYRMSTRTRSRTWLDCRVSSR